MSTTAVQALVEEGEREREKEMPLGVEGVEMDCQMFLPWSKALFL